MAEVIVVGGGPSGLAAAFRLQQAGHRVRVLEAGERAGSTLRTERRDGFLIDRGAFFIPTTHRSLLQLADDAGISGAIRPGGDVFAAVRDGRLHRLDTAHLAKSFKDTTLISGRAKLAAAKLAPEVWRARSATSERIAETGRYDYESLATWARRTQHPEVAKYVIEAAVRSMYAAEAEDLSRVEFLGVIALFGGAKLVAFEGGMGEYGSRLAALCDVTLGAHVSAVEQTADGARVTWGGAGGERSEEVAGAIVAVPARVATRLVPGLDDWRRSFLNRLPKGPLLLGHFGLSREPPDLGATYAMIPRSEHPFLAGIVCDHHKAPGRAPAGKGLITLACCTEWSARHYEDDDEAICAEALAAAERFMPGISDYVEFSAVSRWAQQYPPVGHYAGLGEFQRRSGLLDRTVQLCGEFASTPHLATATSSGERAARALAAHLRD
jgi:protoporphyrinogen/coproporphyrinogen III oxidase